jgi:hypothetical protein
MAALQLAQVNIARLVAPIDSPELADFVANLERFNALAEESPGFVWRLQTEEGDATGIDYFGDDMIVNMSVWKDIESLRNFVYESAHIEILRRRREWFEKMSDSAMVLWWVPEGHSPTLPEADEKLKRLDEHGSTAEAFTFREPYPAP